jgi:hypothetical protein
MRVRHLYETERRKMGRDLNHVEDLVIFYGSDGLREAIDILREVIIGQDVLSIKWDGKVALFYGRDADGVFGLGTKGSWAKNKPLTSPDMTSQYIMTSGKGEEWRIPMGQDLALLFIHLEQSVPESFSGYVTGDLLYSPKLSPKNKTPQGIVFTPNKVTYNVNPISPLGKRVGQTIAGIALHLYFPTWNSDTKYTITDDVVEELNSNQILALGQTYVPHQLTVDPSLLDSLESSLARNGRILDGLIAPRPGLSDISNILYTYNNQITRSGKTASVNGFLAWLSTSAVSNNKQLKLNVLNEENPTYFRTMFDIYNSVKDLKNKIIDQLDSSYTDITATTGDEPGGEGYVSIKNKVKFVPRHRWVPG